MAKHAKLSPSSASRWLSCTKSLELIEELRVKDSGSHYANEGSKAHELLENMLLQNVFEIRSGGYRDWKSDYPEIPVNGDMMEAVQVALNYISDLKVYHRDLIIQPESRVYARSLGEDVYGTADVVCYSPAAKKLWVVDYKHGKGVKVEATDNKQLEIYAIGAIDTFGWMFDDISTIEVVIIQPRCPAEDLIRSAVYSRSDMRMLAIEMAGIIEVIGTSAASFCVSESACRWCPAKAICPALKGRAVKSLGIRFESLESIPEVAEAKAKDEDFLARYLDDKKLIEAWMHSLEVEAMERLSAGGSVGGYKMVAGRSRRKWGLDEEQIIDVLRTDLKLRPSEIFEQKLVSFTKIEKLIDVTKRNGKVKLERFKTLVVKPQGKPVLVNGDDPREPLQPVQFNPLT